MDHGVFDPVTHLSGLAVATELETRELKELRIVEIGTGCGLLAYTCWAGGATVVATDVDARAVACASKNLAATSVVVRQGDLFMPVVGETFDLLITNPPYEVGRSRRPTLRSPDVLVRLAQSWRAHATHLLVAFPVDSADLLEASGFDLDLTVEIPTAGRTLGIFESRQPDSR